jgi:hypothetical protein
MAPRLFIARPSRAIQRMAPRALSLALALSLAAHDARAQSDEPFLVESLPPQTSQPSPAPSEPDPSASDEVVIVVRALPSQSTAQDASDPETPGRTPPVRSFEPPLLPPERPDTPAELARVYAPGVAVGLSFGGGGPAGLLGVFADLAASTAISARVGAAVSANFGPSLDLGVSVRPIRRGRWSGLASLGITAAWTPETYLRLDGLSAPQNSAWLNPAVGVELRLRPFILLRVSVGVSALLNTGAFENFASRGWYGPDRPPAALGWSPVDAADARDAGRALLVPALWLDVGALGPRW